MNIETIVLENDYLKVELLNLGCIIYSFYVKNNDIDICISLKNYEDYLAKNNMQVGKTIGRCANRIGNAKFLLNNIEYKLLANNNGNCLHNGEINFGNLIWDIKEKTNTKVVFHYFSKDMESGFPGNLNVFATFELLQNELIVTYSGVSDKDTLFNMTNHSYFNLDKNKSNIFNHELKINSSYVNLNDENGMAMEDAINVDGTIFDFKKSKKINSIIKEDGIANNILKENNLKEIFIDNLDNNFIVNDKTFLGLKNESFNDSINELCELSNGLLKLCISSDLPCVQVFTAKQMNNEGRFGKNGSYSGIAMEPQFTPNSINYNIYDKPILQKGVKKDYVIKYKVIEL